EPPVSGHQMVAFQGDAGHRLDTAGQEPLAHQTEEVGVKQVMVRAGHCRALDWHEETTYRGKTAPPRATARPALRTRSRTRRVTTASAGVRASTTTRSAGAPTFSPYAGSPSARAPPYVAASSASSMSSSRRNVLR